MGRVRDVVRRSLRQPLGRRGGGRYRRGRVGDHRGVGHRPGSKAQAAGGGGFPRGVRHARSMSGARGVPGGLGGPRSACRPWGVWGPWGTGHPRGVGLGGSVGLPRGGGGHGLVGDRLDRS